MTIRLYRKPEDGAALGANAGESAFATITEEQLDTLVDLLEEEHEGDHDYYVDRDIVDYLEEEGADAELVTLLRSMFDAAGYRGAPPVPDGEGIEIEWREE